MAEGGENQSSSTAAGSRERIGRDAQGVAFLERNFNRNARDVLEISILVQGKTVKDSLWEAIEDIKPKAVYMLLEPSSITKRLLSDADMRENYTVFTCQKMISGEREEMDRLTWISSIKLIPIILTVIKYKWKNIEVLTMFPKSSNSTTVNILNYVWTEIKNGVMHDVAEILETLDSFFCVICTENCPFKRKPWHFGLSDFQRQDWKTPTSIDFLEKNSLWDCLREGRVEPLRQMRNIRNSDDANRLQRLYEVLDENAEEKKNVKFSTYTVLIIDGPGMENFQQTDVMSLIVNPKLYKSVYVGSTKKGSFRHSHFHTKSAIGDLLTNTARIFLFRKVQNLTFVQAKRDEAVVIEILKLHLARYWNDKIPRPFILLNKKSEPCRLLGVEEEDTEYIMRYNLSKIPIYEGYDSKTNSFEEGIFPGNYSVRVQDEILNDFVGERSFADVEPLYKQLQLKRKV